MPAFGPGFFHNSILALLLALPLSGSNQKPQDRPSTRQIRVHTSEVVVDANVTDGDGKPVRGLTQSDFEVYEDGIKQQILSFRSIAGNRIEQGAPLVQYQSEAGQASELVGNTPAYPHLVSIIFDKVNVEHTDAMRASAAASAFINKRLGKNDMAAVFGIGFGVHIFQRFTSDRASLLKAVQDATLGNTRVPGDVSAELRTALQNIPSGGSFIPGVDTDEDKIAFAFNADADTLFKYPMLQDVKILVEFRDIDRESRGNQTLEGLLAIIEGQKVIPGRKSLILLSSGFTVAAPGGQFVGGAMDVRAVTGAANRAGVTIYSVDASGLREQSPEADSQSAAQVAIKSKAIAGPRTSIGLLSAAIGLNTLANLEMLADDTGGYTVRNTSDLVGGMDRIGSYLEEYYVLTYMPANPIVDGKYRTISVKLKRSRLNVRARKGYYALPDTDRLPLLGYEAELLEELNAKAPPNKFPVYVGGYFFPGHEDSSTAAVFVQFPLSELQIERHNDTRSYQAHADIMLLVKKPDGSILYRLSRQYDLDGSLENLESTQKKDFSFYRRVPVPPGEYGLEAIVRDRRTGRASVRKTGFHAASGVQGQLGLSSIILGKDSVLAARNEATENPFRLEDPMQVGKVNIVPDLSGVYRKSADKELSIFFTAQTTQPQTPIQCTLEFHRDGISDIKLQQTLIDTAGRPIPCVTRIGLDQLSLGKYELRVTATDGSGSASGTAQFRVDR
jgi:VWFA-related protein